MITLPKHQNYTHYLSKVVVGILPSLLIFSTLSLPSLAEDNANKLVNNTSNSQTNKVPGQTPTAVPLIQFPTPVDRGQPQRTFAGGRRGDSCIVAQDGKPSLTAIMPTWDNQGKTVNKTSSLYIFVPKNKTEIGEFVVLDEQGNDVYITHFTPAHQQGIVEIKIPASANLKVGEKYKWYFTLICNRDDRSEDEYLSGSLERTTLSASLDSNSQMDTPLRKAQFYASKKIWYDTIHNVAMLRDEQPELWTSLLESVGLEELVNEPFVNLPESQNK